MKIWKLKKKWNIPNGKILYSDIISPEKSLFSSSLGLCGKPDFIIRTKEDYIVPVEIKSGNHQYPKPWHVMQLISYCYLVSESYRKVVPYGILVYNDSKKKFNIPFNDKYHSMLLSTIEQMYYQLHTNMITRNHDNIMKCNHCSMSGHCPERIKK